jgi:hypothetical protein
MYPRNSVCIQLNKISGCTNMIINRDSITQLKYRNPLVYGEHVLGFDST